MKRLALLLFAAIVVCPILVQAEQPKTDAYPNKTTFAFVRAPNHPLLTGLTDRDFCWWPPDNLVVPSGSFALPSDGNVVALLEAGARTGLNWAPLVEVHQGRGRWVLSRLPLEQAAEGYQAMDDWR